MEVVFFEDTCEIFTSKHLETAPLILGLNPVEHQVRLLNIKRSVSSRANNSTGNSYKVLEL